VPPTRSADQRIAGAPISWGVCEVPGWGHQLSPQRVLTEMREVGLAATEVGPAGFLPSDPGKLVHTLADHDLHAVGGFVPVVLHQPGHDPVPDVDQVLDGFVAAHASTIVLSADSGLTGYDSRPTLDDEGWATLLRNLDRLAAAAASRDIRAVLHPHVGTMVEKPDEVKRVLDGSGIALCLDTGHLLIGGTDPAELTRQVPDRIAHTHMKDVDDRFAKRVQGGELTYTEAVREGMYRPLGSGDVDVAAIVSYLERHGYDGWYVLEQDTILPSDPTGEGPVADVRTSVEYLKGLFAKVGT
jgi:inosose dehydratase